jgi:hypothetical protein
MSNPPNFSDDGSGNTLIVSSGGPSLDDIVWDEEEVNAFPQTVENLTSTTKKLSKKPHTVIIKTSLKKGKVKFQLLGKLKKIRFNNKHFLREMAITLSIRTEVILKFMALTQRETVHCPEVKFYFQGGKKPIVFRGKKPTKTSSGGISLSPNEVWGLRNVTVKNSKGEFSTVKIIFSM